MAASTEAQQQGAQGGARPAAASGAPSAQRPPAWDVAFSMAYLVSCALNGAVPDAALAEAVREPGGRLGPVLLRLARAHQVSAACAVALKRAGALSPAWDADLALREYRAAMLDMEREAILADLARAGVRHMPLKGVPISQLYPSRVMREMCDNDILVDEARLDDVDKLMLQRGFKPVPEGDYCVHAFEKEPALSFEMHRCLFSPVVHRDLYDFYAGVWDMVEPDPQGGELAYRLAPTDFYTYVTLHSFKHYRNAGFGLRTLADEAVMLRALEGEVDWGRAEGDLASLGAEPFERTMRSLSKRLFDPALLAGGGEGLRALMRGEAPGEGLAGRGVAAESAAPGGLAPLVQAELSMLRRVLESGAYGTVEQAARNRVRNAFGTNESLGPLGDGAGGGSSADGKARYILKRMFPPLVTMRLAYPVLQRPGGVLLVPGVYLFRIVRALTARHGKTSIELEELRRAGK